MPIALPVTETPVATVTWGIPMTNEVNRLTTLTAPTAWVGLTLVNSWTNFGGTNQVAQYRKLGDIVYLRGELKSTGFATLITTLPVGYRVPATQEFPAMYFDGTNRKVGALQLGTDGTLYANETITLNAKVSLLMSFSTVA